MRAVPWAIAVVLVFAGCGDSPPRAGKAPSGEVAAPAEGSAAIVVALAGSVTVRNAAGVEVPATPQLHLARTDRVVTAPGAYAVLVLHNGYVVRLDEDLVSPVGELAWIDAPPAEKGLEELFAAALSPAEIERAGGSQTLLRIAGWNARRAAGESPAALQPGSEAADEAKPEVAEPSQAAKAAPPADVVPDAPATDDDAAAAPPAGKASRPQSDAKKAPQPAKKKTSRDPGKDAPEAEQLGGSPSSPVESSESKSGAADLEDRWSFRTGSGTQVRKDSLPAALAARRRELARCVAEASPGSAAVELLLRVEGGEVRKVTLGGGARAPGCASELVGLKLPEVAETGWVAVRVRR